MVIRTRPVNLPARVTIRKGFLLRPPIQRAEHRLERRDLDVRIGRRAEDRRARAGLDLEVGHRFRLRAGAERMLGVGDDLERLDDPALVQRHARTPPPDRCPLPRDLVRTCRSASRARCTRCPVLRRRHLAHALELAAAARGPDTRS